MSSAALQLHRHEHPENGVVIPLVAGQVLFREGDQGGGLYFVKEGKLEIYRERDGTEVVLGLVASGDVLGTLTLFTQESRTASVRAQGQASVLYMTSECLANGMKAIPTWAQAIMKDTVARLKFVDELLVQSHLAEKKLRSMVGTSYHHAAQVANLLSSLSKIGSVDEDGVLFFPLKGFVLRCELVLLLKGSYIEKIFKLFVSGGLAKTVENKKYGYSIQSPKPQIYEDFGIFSINCVRHGLKDFAPSRMHQWMSALVRLYKKFPERESWTRVELAAQLSKETNRQVSDAFIAELLHLKIVRPKGGSDDVLYSASQLQKRLIFETICKSLEGLTANEIE